MSCELAVRLLAAGAAEAAVVWLAEQPASATVVARALAGRLTGRRAGLVPR